MTVRSVRRFGSIVAVLALFTVVACAAGKTAINLSRGQLALGGYDAVAYIADGKALPGSASFEFRWMDATWRFVSADHRDQFSKDPQRYAPQFGGYCAYAVSQGHTANGDPKVWRVVDGRLYLNYSTNAQKLWEQDVPGNIPKGQQNWASVLTK